MSFASHKFLTPAEDLHLSVLLDKERSRNSLILTLLRRYGMRQSELLLLRPCDLNPEAKSMKIPGLKGSNPRELPLSDDLFLRLSEQAATCPSEDMKIFPIGRHMVQAIWRYWRPCNKPLHALRHTFAIEMYKKTQDIHLVKNLLGHKSIANTLIYLDFVQSQDEFRKALVG